MHRVRHAARTSCVIRVWSTHRDRTGPHRPRAQRFVLARVKTRIALAAMPSRNRLVATRRPIRLVVKYAESGSQSKRAVQARVALKSSGTALTVEPCRILLAAQRTHAYRTVPTRTEPTSHTRRTTRESPPHMLAVRVGRASRMRHRIATRSHMWREPHFWHGAPCQTPCVHARKYGRRTASHAIPPTDLSAVVAWRMRTRCSPQACARAYVRVEKQHLQCALL